MSTQPQYNPNSIDAQFAKVFQVLEHQNKMLEHQDKEHERKWKADELAFSEIMKKQDLTNGRVNGLEKREQYAKGKVAGIAIACSAGTGIIGWVVSHLI